MIEQIGTFNTLKITEPTQTVLQVTLSRPASLNALNTQMGHELYQLFEAIGLDPNLYRAIVLTGSGDRAFCAGGDLKERNNMTDGQWQAQHLVFERMVRAIMDCPVPVIAAVNGAAYGGGTEIALCCDYIYAANTARFALTEVTLGIMPGCGGTQNLARAVGERRAKEMVMSGTPISATKAHDWGLVNALFDTEELLSAAHSSAERIAKNAPLAVRQVKQAIHTGIQMDIASALRVEIEAYNRLIPTQDRLEGVRAFNEKRTPHFEGK